MISVNSGKMTKNLVLTKASALLCCISLGLGILLGVWIPNLGYDNVKTTFFVNILFFVHSVAWVVRYYCQLFLNRIRYSTLGFNKDFWYLSLLSTACALIVTGNELWGYSRLVRVHISIHVNDAYQLISSVNGFATTILIIAQGLIFNGKENRPSIASSMIIFICFTISVIYLCLELVEWKHPSTAVVNFWITIVNYVAISCSIGRYIPAITENYMRKKFIGIDMGFISLEFFGAVSLSLFVLFSHQCPQSVSSLYCAKESIRANLPRFIEGASITILSFVMILQFVLYRSRGSIHVGDFHEGCEGKGFGSDGFDDNPSSGDLSTSFPIDFKEFSIVTDGGAAAYTRLTWTCYECSHITSLSLSKCTECGLSNEDSDRLHNLSWIFD